MWRIQKSLGTKHSAFWTREFHSLQVALSRCLCTYNFGSIEVTCLFLLDYGKRKQNKEDESMCEYASLFQEQKWKLVSDWWGSLLAKRKFSSLIWQVAREQLCMKECACAGLWNDRGTERACGRLPLKISPKAPLPSFLMILKRPSRISCPSWYMSRLSKTVTKLCDIISDQTRRTNTCLLYSQSLSSLTGSLTGIKIVFFIKSALTQIIT